MTEQKEKNNKINLGEWSEVHEKMQDKIGDDIVDRMTGKVKSDTTFLEKKYPDLFKLIKK